MAKGLQDRKLTIIELNAGFQRRDRFIVKIVKEFLYVL